VVRDEIREELLDAALAEFAEKGFDGASTRAIARRIGAHQPQIHYHFESKEALWCAAVDHLFAKLGQEMGQLDLTSFATDSVDPSLRAVRAATFAEMIRHFVRFAAAHPELNRIMVHEATVSSERLDWMVEHHVRPLYEAGRSMWKRLQRDGVAAPINDRLFHYVLVGAASILFVNAPEARLLLGVEPTLPRWVKAHADGLVAILLPGAERAIRPTGRRAPGRAAKKSARKSG